MTYEIILREKHHKRLIKIEFTHHFYIIIYRLLQYPTTSKYEKKLLPVSHRNLMRLPQCDTESIFFKLSTFMNECKVPS